MASDVVPLLPLRDVFVGVVVIPELRELALRVVEHGADDVRADVHELLMRPLRGTRKSPCMRGRRTSQSTSSTRRPSLAKLTARLADVSVFPSPGAALVTTSVRSRSPPSDQTRLVRNMRNASVPIENGGGSAP